MRHLHSAALCAALLVGACAAPEGPEATAPVATAPEGPAPEAPAPEEAAVAEAPADPPVERTRDERADEVVRAMSEALKRATRFSVRLEAWSDEHSADGSLVAIGAETRLSVRRPDGFHAERISERGVRRYWYDGRTFAALDVDRNLYAKADAPPTIEQTVDALEERFGIVMPLADLLVDDPYDSYTRGADRVDYLGTQLVRGVPCHHVWFEGPDLEWQIWIAAEGDPLPRRVQITYADEAGEPRFLCHLDDWKTGDAAEAAEFTFSPPSGAVEIEIAPRQPAGGDASGGNR
jgi:hypothetical protein